MDDETTDAAMAGEFATETLDYDGGRRVTVYIPPARPEAIVFAGDGQSTRRRVQALDAGTAESTMVVGTHRSADETVRLQEYSPPIAPERFAAHERFFVGDVRRWVASRFGVDLPPARTAVFGVSAGAELALALGLRHPSIYGVALGASPGAGYRPPVTMPVQLPRVYLVAGTSESFFLENAARWATALHGAGADVVMHERDGSHGGAFWNTELSLMVRWAFGK